MKRLIFLSVLLWFLFPISGHALTVTVNGVEVTVTYTEPTENKCDPAVGCSTPAPLQDLSHTNVYFELASGGGPQKQPDIPASTTAGGGPVSTTVTVPILEGQEDDVTFWATATDTSGNESDPSNSVVRRFDRLAPAPPK